MLIQSIDGCIGCGTCMKTCPTDVTRKEPKADGSMQLERQPFGSWPEINS